MIALCFSLRLLFFLLSHPWTYSVEDQLNIQSDSPLYHRLATNILDSGQFASDGTGAPSPLQQIERKGALDNLRTPGYPLYISMIYGLFGRYPWIVFLAQIFLDTISCGVLFLSLQRILGRRTAFFSSVFYAADPFFILHSSLLLSEILFGFFMVLLVFIFVTFFRSEPESPPMLGAALVGSVVGVSALIRPISQFLIIPLAVVFLVIQRRRPLSAVKTAGTMVVSFLIVLTPWLIRNHHHFGQYSLSYIGGYDFLTAKAAPLEAFRRGQDLERVQEALLREADSMIAEEGQDPQSVNFLKKAVYWKRLAMHYILKDPFRYALLHAKGVVFIFVSFGTSGFAQTLHLPSYTVEKDRAMNFIEAVKSFLSRKTATELLVAGIILPLLIVTNICLITGLMRGWSRTNALFLVFCLIPAIYFVILPGPLGTVRFKMPAVPFYLSFVGLGAAYWLERFKSRR